MSVMTGGFARTASGGAYQVIFGGSLAHVWASVSYPDSGGCVATRAVPSPARPLLGVVYTSDLW